MTTATTASPLESYQKGRDQFLAVMLETMSGLESSVLDFQHQHEGQVRAVGYKLSAALTEQSRLEAILGEQALELDASRTHVCPAPAAADAGIGCDEEGLVGFQAAAAVQTAAPAEDAVSVRMIAELTARLENEERTTAGLRMDLEGRDRRIASLEAAAESATGNSAATLEAHEKFLHDVEANFEARHQAGIRSAEALVRGKAVQIIEAIAADNPALAEAADLFTVAFPAEAGDEVHPASAAPEVPAIDDLFAAIAPETETALTPITQAYTPAADFEDNPILDSSFFDTPAALGEPAVDAGHADFGRRKDAATI